MDDKRKVTSQIQPLDEDELEKDLRFVYQNRSDTVDQFIEEMIPIFKYHANEVMAAYQDKLLDGLTESLRGEIAGIILRMRRETVIKPKEGKKDETATLDW